MSEKIYFAKTNTDAKLPSKPLDENAGYDVYACFEQDYIAIQPHKTVMIPTGIASVCSDDYYFQIFERGSTGTKGMGQRCGVIDSGYRGEWFIPITNHNNNLLIIVKTFVKDVLTNIGLSEHIIIYPYEKAICQAVLLPVPKVEVEYISHDELLNIKSIRGLGKLGSSGQ